MKKPSENLFKGGDNGLHNNCLKCGSDQKKKNCFKRFDCSGIFCYKIYYIYYIYYYILYLFLFK